MYAVLGKDCIRFSAENLQLTDSLPTGLILDKKEDKALTFKITGSGLAYVRVDKIYLRPISRVVADFKGNVITSVEFAFDIGGVTPSPPPPSIVPIPFRPTANPWTRPDRPWPTIEPDLLAYEEALSQPDSERIHALRVFLEKYPRSPWAVEAKKRVPLDLVKKKAGFHEYARLYSLRYSSCQPFFVYDSMNIYGKIERDTGTDFQITIAGTQFKAYELYLVDTCKYADVRVFRCLVSGDEFFCLLDTTDVAYTLRFIGGNFDGRFWIEYIKDGNLLPGGADFIAASDTTYRFLKEYIRKKTGADGDITMRIIEDNVIYPVEGSVFVPPALPLWPFILALLLVGGISFFYNRHQAILKYREMIANMRPTEEIIIRDYGWVQSPTSIPGSRKVQVRDNYMIGYRSLKENEFDGLLQKEPHLWLRANDLWPETTLADIYLSQKCVQGISRFLREYKKSEWVEKTGFFPEVHGFFLGQYFASKGKGKGKGRVKDQYRVAVLEFVPSVAEQPFEPPPPFQVNTDTIMNAIHEMQRKHPQLEPLGWFHVHPGQGLFLSQSDLYVHEAYFTDKHQFALEIDTETPQWDTGFFTRKSSGVLNNVGTEEPTPNWFHWKEIERNIEL